MKTTVVLCFATLLSVSAHAQLFRPETVNGAILGGVAGAVIGNNSGDLHHNGARGAAIGAATGAVIGSAVGQSRESAEYRSQGYPRSSSSWNVRVGAGYGYRGDYWGSRHAYYGRYPYRNYGWYGPRVGYTWDYYYTPDYSYYSPAYSEPDYSYSSGGSNYAASGALLGGIAGAIIGNNSGHHNGWGGAAIGAGAGLLLGAIADDAHRDRVVSVPAQSAPSQAVASQGSAAATSSTPQNVTVINNYYGSSGSSMSSANSMFGR